MAIVGVIQSVQRMPGPMQGGWGYNRQNIKFKIFHVLKKNDKHPTENISTQNGATKLHPPGSAIPCSLSIAALRIGFTRENISAPEGDEIMVCAKILSGVLGPTPEILLDYIINAPRENLDLPEGRVDSATCMLNCSDSCTDYYLTI